MDKPSDLVFDIETSPMLVFAWQLGKQDISYKNIYKERQVLCIGYAFNDDPPSVINMDYDQFDLHVRDNDADKEMIQKFIEIVGKADRVIGHNAKRFDISVLRSRIVKHQLPDFQPLLVDDTYSQTKDIGFSSHKLDYMTGFLGLEQKKDHPYEMWLDVVNKVPGAFEDMQEYCKGDIESTRQMYKRLQPYTQSQLNMSIWMGKPTVCPHCGSKRKAMVRKYRMTRTGRYPQFQCMDCGRYFSNGTNYVKKSGTYMR